MSDADLRQIVVEWDTRLMKAVLKKRSYIRVVPQEVLELVDALDVALEELNAVRAELARQRNAHIERSNNHPTRKETP